MSSFFVAAAQYDITILSSWEEYCDKIDFWIEQARTSDASICVFPEYGSFEITSFFDPSVQKDVDQTFTRLQDYHNQFIDLFSAMSQKHGLVVVAPSLPVREQDVYRNRVYVFSPKGDIEYQDKIVMTRFEKRWRNMVPALTQKVFNTPFGNFGIAICYDSEFPLLVRRIVEAGAHFIVVPSCTDSYAGYYRVRIACQARALENQCYVVQSPTVGLAHWSPAVDENYGAAAIYSPPDLGFPFDGVVSEGAMNQPQWVIGNIDLRAIDRVRRHGQVHNHLDWEHQLPNNCALENVDWT